MDSSSVRVAVRVRPQSSREKIDACQICTSAQKTQITIGADKSFTFDYLYDRDSGQSEIYDETSRALIDGTFNGYNATIFAYGQTGSGKTYTMGTGFDVSYDSVDSDFMGIVPRAVSHLFEEIDRKEKLAAEQGKPIPDFKVLAQFIEIYYEDIIDLLDVTRDPNIKQKSKIKIHENACGEILTMGATTKPVRNRDETMSCLRNGALSRTTASTDMNSQSSRSHAIFTLYVRQQRVTDSEGDDVEILTSKFHFVDLAGSERLKRTKATGHRAREGISINCGLLSLGNVISALGDTSKKISHVPYRDSKLTRLLQDSLGGNSRTLMIACVSPSDRDFMETLNTLKYANRARNIKNVISVNQDKTSVQIAQLKREITDLQQKLEAYKGNTLMCEDNLKIRSLKETIEKLNKQNSEMISQKILYPLLDDPERDQKLEVLVNKYILENETLKAKLFEREKQLEHKNSTRDLLEIAKLDLYASKNRSRSARLRNGTTPTSAFDNTATTTTPGDTSPRPNHRPRHQRRHRRRPDVGGASSDGASCTEEDEAARGIATPDDDSLDEEDSPGHGYTSSDYDEAEEEDEEEDEDEDEGCSSAMPLLSENLADLTSDISIKEKLICELELSRRRIETMKSQYESKVQVLLVKIATTEKERDEMIENLDKQGNVKHIDEKVFDIKKKYENRITEMKGELKRMGKQEREQAKIIRNKMEKERELASMHNELKAMKTQKVKLMQQIKSETLKNQDIQKVRNTETHRHKRQLESKDTKIRNLEAMTLKKDMFLKRKHDEIEALKKKTNVARGRAIRVHGVRGHQKQFSAKSAKSKWDRLNDYICESIMKKRTQSCLENDMQNWIKQRSKLSRELEKNKSDVNSEKSRSLQDNMSYIQEKINECQDSIVEFENSRVSDMDCDYMLKDCQLLEESKYLLKHSIQMTMNKGALATQFEHESRELKAKLHHERQDATLQREIIEYLVESHPLSPVIASINFPDNNDDSDSSTLDLFDSGSNTTSAAYSPLTTPTCTAIAATPVTPMGATPTHKARRKTQTTENLLYDVCPRSQINSATPTNSERPPRDKMRSSADVFSRLTTCPASPNPSRGVISENTQKTPNLPLIQTHVASGHSKSILSLHATDSLLFSSSKDHTCKQWDLTTGLETLCLTGHHNNVTSIIARNSLIYTVCAYYVQLWDSRIGNRSAGFATEEACGKVCPPSETTINDMALNSDGTIMYTAAGNNVKIWDLRSDKAVGKLSGGHQSAIMVLAVDDMDTANGNICIVTGSKDHYIKVFEVCEDTVGQQSAQYNLEPPHYDGIQSLCLLGDLLFSGSRDMCIKKWDLSSQTLKQSINGAHKDWICGLALLPDAKQQSPVGDCLVSACRSGILKLWSIDDRNCQQLSEIDVIPKRNGLNTITTNDSLIFTGSSDIGIWKPNFDEFNFTV